MFLPLFLAKSQFVISITLYTFSVKLFISYSQFLLLSVSFKVHLRDSEVILCLLALGSLSFGAFVLTFFVFACFKKYPPIQILFTSSYSLSIIFRGRFIN